MVKNKRLRKLSLCFFSLILIVVSIVSPAFAAGLSSGSDSSNDIYPLISFDGFELVSVDRNILFPWPYSVFYNNSTIIRNEINVGDWWFKDAGGYMPSTRFYDATITPGWTPSAYPIRFFSDELYLPANIGSGQFVFSLLPLAEASARCVVSFDVASVVKQNGAYFESLTSYSVSGTGSTFDISGMIASIVRDLVTSTDRFVHIRNLVVSVTEISTCDEFGLSVYAPLIAPNDGYDFFNSQGLVIPIVPPSAEDFSLDWLVSSVSGFLDVEIWDGFTLNGVLAMAFLIGLIFLFLKFTI